MIYMIHVILQICIFAVRIYSRYNHGYKIEHAHLLTKNTLQKHVNCPVRFKFDMNPILVRVLLQHAVRPKDYAHGSALLCFVWMIHDLPISFRTSSLTLEQSLINRLIDTIKWCQFQWMNSDENRWTIRSNLFWRDGITSSKLHNKAMSKCFGAFKPFL